MHATALAPLPRSAPCAAPRWPRPRLVTVFGAPAPARPDEHGALILAIAARADREAFAGLFRHFAPRVKSYLLRFGAAPDAAEEFAQETMLTVWRKAGSFDPARAAASTWIFTIARNLRVDAARRERRAAARDDDPSMAADAPERPDEALAAGDDERRVGEGLAALPPEQARVIRLAYFSDKAHSEIAAELGLPLGTVKSRLRLATARLRDLLREPT